MKLNLLLFCLLLALFGTASGSIQENQPPEANAGQDATYYDTDGDGLEEVPLDGSQSRDVDGRITRYEWKLDGKVIARGERPVVALWVGTYEITLTVTDNRGEKDSDSVTIGVSGTVCDAGIMFLEGVTDGEVLHGVVNIHALLVPGGEDARVTFELTGPDGDTYTHTERRAPYYFLGDSGGIPHGWDTDIYPPGHYRLKVTFYEGRRPCETQILNLLIEELPPPQCADIAIKNTIYGTNGSETIYGTPQNDFIFAGKGSDDVYGRGGDDCIVGGQGSDDLYGEAGNDVLLGEAGNDDLSGGPDSDTLYGGPGHDELFGDGYRRQWYQGNPGRDKLYGDAGHDELYGGPNNDLLQGGDGSDELYGQDDNDMLAGNAGDDEFYGGAGVDVALDYTRPPDSDCHGIESGCKSPPQTSPDAVDDYFVADDRVDSTFQVLTNDNPGIPAATVVSYGGGDLGGSVTDRVAGAWAVMPNNVLVRLTTSGALTVHQTTPAGVYTFQYRLQNANGFDDATITVEVQKVPDARDDKFVMQLYGTLTGDLTEDNGHGPDITAGDSLQFGGWDLPGNPYPPFPYQAPASVPFAGGTLTIQADGTFELVNPTSAGTFYFLYDLWTDTAVVTIEIQGTTLTANADMYTVDADTELIVPAPGVLANDTLDGGVLVSFGGRDAGGPFISYLPGTTAPFAGGMLTLNEDGSLVYTPAPGFSGEVNFFYDLQNTGTTSQAMVTIHVGNLQPPDAQDDEIVLEAYGMEVSLDLTGNDNSGFPQAQVVQFGGGDVGAFYTVPASVPFAGGTLIVTNFGGVASFRLQNPTMFGTFTFQYRLQNAAGFDDATVTLELTGTPFLEARGDEYTMEVNTTLFEPAPGVLGDDDSQPPYPALVSFGGGDAGGTSTSYLPDTTIPFAGGILTLYADGSLRVTNPTIPGVYFFQYRVQNSLGFRDGNVLITVLEP